MSTQIHRSYTSVPSRGSSKRSVATLSSSKRTSARDVRRSQSARPNKQRSSNWKHPKPRTLSHTASSKAVQKLAEVKDRVSRTGINAAVFTASAAVEAVREANLVRLVAHGAAERAAHHTRKGVRRAAASLMDASLAMPGVKSNIKPRARQVQLLLPGRIRALIQVFSEGNQRLRIRANPSKAAELRWLLNQRWEPDTACWVPGQSIRQQHHPKHKGNCYCCSSSFSWASRRHGGGSRHHCRRCGKLVCGLCSEHRIGLWVYWSERRDGSKWDGTPCLHVVNARGGAPVGGVGHADHATDDDHHGKKFRVCDLCVKDMVRLDHETPDQERTRRFQDRLTANAQMRGEPVDAVSVLLQAPKTVAGAAAARAVTAGAGAPTRRGGAGRSGVDADTVLGGRPLMQRCVLCNSPLPKDTTHHGKLASHAREDSLWGRSHIEMRDARNHAHHRKAICLACANEKRHSSRGFLHSHQVVVSDLPVGCTEMDVFAAVERLFPLSVDKVVFAHLQDQLHDPIGVVGSSAPGVGGGDESDDAARATGHPNRGVGRFASLRTNTGVGEEDEFGAIIVETDDDDESGDEDEAETAANRQRHGGSLEAAAAALVTEAEEKEAYLSLDDLLPPPAALDPRRPEPSRETLEVVVSLTDARSKSSLLLLGRAPGLPICVPCGPDAGCFRKIVATVSPMPRGPGIDRGLLVQKLFQRLADHRPARRRARLARQAHRAFGNEARCIGGPGCAPGKKKMYCATCGGVRFFRGDILGGKVGSHAALLEAVRADDAVRLRALLRLKVPAVAGIHAPTAIDDEGVCGGDDDNAGLKDAMHRFLDLSAVRGPLGSTALHLCVDARASRCLDVLLGMRRKYPGMFDWRDANGMTVLHACAIHGGWNVRRLLRTGMPLSAEEHPLVGAADKSGKLPVHYAALKGDEDTIRALLEVGGNVQYQLLKQDSSGQRAVDLSADRQTMTQLQQAEGELELSVEQ